MNRRETFAVVMHTRWTDDEEPRATVIRTRDEWAWFQVCDTDPDTAREIAEALGCMAELEALRVAGDALAEGLRRILDGVGEDTEEDDLLATWEEARRG